MPDAAPTAVFLSYAREDADATRRIADALRGFGVEVWFDQSELRGGDAWDQKIRRQIKDCAMFVPVISTHTEARGEGYFRLEWKLADERTHLMAKGVPFLLPVVVDDTRDGDAMVPDSFRAVQWTRLPGAAPTPEFVAQVKRLLESPRRSARSVVAGVADPGPSANSRSTVEPASARPPTAPGPASLKIALGAVAALAIGLAAFIGLRPSVKDAATAPAKSRAETAPIAEPKPAVPVPVAAATPVAPDKSVAVLPFANLSTEKENEFFADGLQDDVITSLAKIRDLTVISRTSTLAYRDTASRNMKKIGSDLNVATVLEGSVRRVGSKVHMNAQLIDARTDAHLWANTFEGDASDPFALQASLAQKIAVALKATLTPGERTLIERRPTQNQEAYELYTRARLQHQVLFGANREAYERVVALYEQAIAKDPAFPLAFAQLSIVHGTMYWYAEIDPTPERRMRAETALATARRLAPVAPETHLAQGAFAYLCNNDWQGALAEYAVAEPEMPNDAQLQARIAAAHRRLGQWTEAVSRFERAATLDPHDLDAVVSLVGSTVSMRRYEQGRALATRYLAIIPGNRSLRASLARAQFALDDDRPAYVRAQRAIGPGLGDPFGLRHAYDLAMLARDLTAAERALADPRLTTLVVAGGIAAEPVALRRAQLAFLRGEREAAVKFSDEAIAFYRSRTWTPRQQRVVLSGIAEAEAYAGRVDAALRDGRAVITQGSDRSAAAGEGVLGRIYVALDRRDDALASLRKVMDAPGPSPHELCDDPMWSRLKDDPRFEEILKSAKVF